MSELPTYPANDFVAAVKRWGPEDVEGGFHQSPRLTVKAVLPQIERGKSVRYRVQTALVLFGARIRKSMLEYTDNEAVLKGFGVPDFSGEKPHSEILSAAFEYGIDVSMGAGAIPRLWEAFRSRYFYFLDEAKQTVAVNENPGEFGTARSLHRTFPNTAPLQKSGFPFSIYVRRPSSGVILNTWDVGFTEPQTEHIVDHARKIPVRYGGVPRLVLRSSYREEDFSHVGLNPEAELFWHFVSDSDKHREENGKMRIDVGLLQHKNREKWQTE